MIPRLLHFTWKTQDLQGEMRDYFVKWQQLHPGWDIRLWTDDSMRAFVADSHPDFLATYDSYPKMIQRADAFRYLVLDTLGGIYADLDVEPLKSVEPLLKHTAFIGVEPLEHITEDGKHQGVPYLITNAFMGSVPNHILWRQIIAEMPGLADQEVFHSTGPYMVTAMTLRLAKADRPVLLLPEVWSPLLSSGLPGKSDAALAPMLSEVGDVISAGSGALVSHKWFTTWVPWHKRANRWKWVFQIPTLVKWWARRQINRDLANVKIFDPLFAYVDQEPKLIKKFPTIHVAVRVGQAGIAPGLVAALKSGDYPADRLSFSLHAGSALSIAEDEFAGVDVWRADYPNPAARDNAILSAYSQKADLILLVDAALSDIPRDALHRLVSSGRPVVSANFLDENGNNADPSLFRYEKGAPFKILYKDGGSSGVVSRNPVYRIYLRDQRVFTVLPLDGVGESFVLIRREVVDAGVRFAETPYKLHLGAEAFGIMARDKGFEVAGLPGVVVRRS
ncbi:glycosyltransferase family 32 protein [Devosia epidermidihirudinis]|uniref:glycosyltransferase family 32 protein n=1 Tax=Devosia epidermidihirudinis TaxID=1293439 RepID=UPI0006966CBF|nr:glycosyltransferase [Devosia epidermidihirudinis]